MFLLISIGLWTLEAGRISKVNQLDLPRITEVADEEQPCCTLHNQRKKQEPDKEHRTKVRFTGPVTHPSISAVSS